LLPIAPDIVGGGLACIEKEVEDGDGMSEGGVKLAVGGIGGIILP